MRWRRDELEWAWRGIVRQVPPFNEPVAKDGEKEYIPRLPKREL